MKHNRIFFTAGLMLVLLTSCDDFLEPYPSAIRSEEYIWNNPSTVEGLITKCYDYMPRNYDDIEGAFLDAATDNAVYTSRTDKIARFANGTISPTDDPFETYWERDYKGIYLANMFLKDDRGYKTRFLLDAHHNELLQRKLKGEAFALRAWFQWDLLRKFGGRGIDSGELLGFPILLEPIKVAGMEADEISTEINFKRDTYEACVKQIVNDCDSALKYLPIAHRDFLVQDANDRVVLGSRNWGRLDGISMTAIKSLVYLTWASPRFNPEGDMSRWDKAAKFAKEVMDFKMTVDNVSGGFDVNKRVNWLDPNNAEIVYGSRYKNSNDDIEKAFYPGGFQGNGVIGASQDLVDAFGMADGYPVGTSPTYTYDPQNPYLNRDKRFYSTIFYNDRTISVGNTNPQSTYTFEAWTGGKDSPGLNQKNSRTGYYIKKFVFMGLNWSDNTINRQPHSKFFIRWSHMVLAYAEAANQLAGPTGQVYGLTARDAISYLRNRNTYDNESGLTRDPYLDRVALEGKSAFDEFLRNERRIETCFEGLWFYDIRRWSVSLGELNKPVHGASITRRNNSTFQYDLNAVVDNRYFTSAYLPIPYREVMTMKDLEQNEGWDTWK